MLLEAANVKVTKLEQEAVGQLEREAVVRGLQLRRAQEEAEATMALKVKEGSLKEGSLRVS